LAEDNTAVNVPGELKKPLLRTLAMEGEDPLIQPTIMMEQEEEMHEGEEEQEEEHELYDYEQEEDEEDQEMDIV
jgi:hypothetical protein